MPAAVYWRRRLIAVAVALVLVWVVLRVIGGDDQSAAESDIPAAPAPPPAIVPTNGTFEVAFALAASACDPQQVRVTPTIPGGQPAGGSVTINLVVSSTGSAPCTLQPADAGLIAVISANGTPLWDSTLCSASLLLKPVQLAGGGWAAVTSTVWSGRVSGASCASSESFVGPGRYSVQVGTLGGEPGKTSFELG